MTTIWILPAVKKTLFGWIECFSAVAFVNKNIFPLGPYLLTYLLHGAESFLRNELVLQLIKKFPAFYGTRKFINVLTTARQLSLSWANSIQSSQPLPTSRRSIFILSSHLRLGLPNGLFPSGFPTKTHVLFWQRYNWLNLFFYKFSGVYCFRYFEQNCLSTQAVMPNILIFICPRS